MTKAKNTSNKTHKQGRKEMRNEILAAIELQFQRATGYDVHERDSSCEVCETWYRALDAAKGVKP